ncbi:hypothetical protein BDV12DRAFT_209954 [Aspergillus spectabilis]
MPHSVLITGVSGYIGGMLLARLSTLQLTSLSKLFVLVRTDAQAEACRRYGAEPLQFDDAYNQAAILEAIVQSQITIVYFLIIATSLRTKGSSLKLLPSQRITGLEAHFIFTTGTKQFGSYCGALTDCPLLDTDLDLYNAQTSVKVNCDVIDKGGDTVWEHGKGKVFGNRISIHIVGITWAAKEAGRVYRVEPEQNAWPNPGYGKNGYYFASSGRVAWNDLLSNDSWDARSPYTAEHGKEIGWSPQFPAQHILEAADEEVDFIPNQS